jgi:hypothetical protein
VLVGSQNQNREWLYSQQQTVSSEGYSGHAFSTFVPHTVSTSETKVCTDCHISKANDNNATMAQLLMQGTNFVNFIGRFAWVASGRHGIHAVVVTERDEPQAVIGSSLHKLAYPDEYAQHVKGGDRLTVEYEHTTNHEALDIQIRGEYAYVAAACAFTTSPTSTTRASASASLPPRSPLWGRNFTSIRSTRPA